MSTTPRTDALLFGLLVACKTPDQLDKMADFARELEQENAAQKRWMESAVENLPLLQAEVAQLREAIEAALGECEAGQWGSIRDRFTDATIAKMRAAIAPNATGKHT